MHLSAISAIPLRTQNFQKGIFSSFSWVCCGARRALLWAMLWLKRALVSHPLTSGFLEHSFLLAEEQHRTPKQDAEAHARALCPALSHLVGKDRSHS